MGPLWLDAATLGTFIDDLSRFQLQTVRVLFGGVALRNRPLTGEVRPSSEYDGHKQASETIQCLYPPLRGGNINLYSLYPEGRKHQYI